MTKRLIRRLAAAQASKIPNWPGMEFAETDQPGICSNPRVAKYVADTTRAIRKISGTAVTLRVQLAQSVSLGRTQLRRRKSVTRAEQTSAASSQVVIIPANRNADHAAVSTALLQGGRWRGQDAFWSASLAAW